MKKISVLFAEFWSKREARGSSKRINIGYCVVTSIILKELSTLARVKPVNISNGAISDLVQFDRMTT